MKKTGTAILLFAFLLVQPLYGQTVDRIVAVVNGDIITLSDLNGAFEPYRKKIEEAYRPSEREKALHETRSLLLKKLIDSTLIEQEAKKNGISIKDEEIEVVIKDITSRKNISEKELIAGLAGEGLSFEAYKNDIKDQLIRMKLIRREIKSKVIVTDGEIKEYYIKHRGDYEGREAVRIQQIFIAFPKGANKEIKDKLKQEISEVQARLSKGESFEIIAAKYAQGPAGAANGDLGFMEKGTMLPEVDSAAFNLKKGETSGVIQSGIGFHIIKVMDKRGAGAKNIDELREEIQIRIEEQKLEKKFEEWLGNLRSRSHIEVKL